MMKQIVIIGAGGHGREVAEILRDQQNIEKDIHVLGFIDENKNIKGKLIDHLPVLGGWEMLEERAFGDVYVICAVGTPAICRKLVYRAVSLDLPFVSAISPLAHISPMAKIGKGVTIFPNVILNTGAAVGDYSILNVSTTVSHDSKIGQFVNMNPGAQLAGNVTVEDGSYIGMGTKIIQSKRIGCGTTVGAGSVVIRDLPENVTAVGVPAEIIKHKKEIWNEY